MQKKKHLRANHATFVTEEFRKAVMQRARLRNAYLKNQTEATKAICYYQQNICVNLLRKLERSYFENIDVQLVRDNKKFGKTLRPLFQIKSNLKRDSHLLKMRISFQMIKKIAETFHKFFSKVVKTLNISKNPHLISGTSQTDPVLQSNKKFSKHPSKINIKNKISNSNCTSNLKLKRNFLN